MRVVVLSSGSKGNATYIETDKVKILVDIGVSCKYIENSLQSIGVDPSSISALFISHSHSDHVKGMNVFLKKYHPILYLTNKIAKEIEYVGDYEKIKSEMKLEDLNIKAIHTSHDVAESFGYIFCNDEKSVVYLTDTGYVKETFFSELSNKNIYIIESNHDVEMLMNGKYQYYLKQRILSDYGHLSNEACSGYLMKLIGKDTKCVVLSHLSEENNTEELALNTLLKTLEKNHKKIAKIIVAKPQAMTEVIEV